MNGKRCAGFARRDEGGGAAGESLEGERMAMTLASAWLEAGFSLQRAGKTPWLAVGRRPLMICLAFICIIAGRLHFCDSRQIVAQGTIPMAKKKKSIILQ